MRPLDYLLSLPGQLIGPNATYTRIIKDERTKQLSQQTILDDELVELLDA